MRPALLNDAELERSAVVANCRMNRQRRLTGTNGYGRELGFDPLAFLEERIGLGRPVGWLDLCCGEGRALIEAARLLRGKHPGAPIEIIGVDLVGHFDRYESDLTGLTLIEASLRTWRPERRFDLITCVHGLHYLGDKLGLIARAVSWLVEDGVFAASLDLDNLKFADGRPASRGIMSAFRRAGLIHDRRQRRILARGRGEWSLPFRYLGADDTAGPNSTGQPAVDSYYEAISEAHQRPGSSR